MTGVEAAARDGGTSCRGIASGCGDRPAGGNRRGALERRAPMGPLDALDPLGTLARVPTHRPQA